MLLSFADRVSTDDSANPVVLWCPWQRAL